MTHLDASFHDHEMNVGPDKAERWLIQLEKLVGFSLDGDNGARAKAAGTADGYSLDECSDMFDAGYSLAKAAGLVMEGAQRAIGSRRAS